MTPISFDDREYFGPQPGSWSCTRNGRIELLRVNDATVCRRHPANADLRTSGSFLPPKT